MPIIEKTTFGFQAQLDPGAQVLLSEISSCSPPAFLFVSLILNHSLSSWWQMVSRSPSFTPYQLINPIEMECLTPNTSSKSPMADSHHSGRGPEKDWLAKTESALSKPQ